MKKSLHKKIVKQMAMVAEEAFRRGLQHGVHYAIDNTIGNAKVQDKAHELRFFKPMEHTYEMFSVVHGGRFSKHSVVERFEGSAQKYSELADFLKGYYGVK